MRGAGHSCARDLGMGAADAAHWLLCIKRRTGLSELYWDELGEDISVRSDEDCPAAAPVLDRPSRSSR
jgi:hypothetical protein